MTIKEFLYEEWCDTYATSGEAKEVFYDKYIPPCAPSEIENLFIDALTEEGQRAFYAGLEAFRRVALEFGLCGSIDTMEEKPNE